MGVTFLSMSVGAAMWPSPLAAPLLGLGLSMMLFLDLVGHRLIPRRRARLRAVLGVAPGPGLRFVGITSKEVPVWTTTDGHDRRPVELVERFRRGALETDRDRGPLARLEGLVLGAMQPLRRDRPVFLTLRRSDDTARVRIDHWADGSAADVARRTIEGN